MEEVKNKILITGASGFLGRHLLMDIDPLGFDIHVITRDISKKINNIPASAKIFEADLNNYDSLKKAFVGIDVIINCAAEVRNANKLEETNIQGTKNLIKAAVENRVSKIIHLSSVGVVGSQYNATSKSIDELSVCDPKNEYERTKLESERLLLEAKKLNSFSLIIIRPTNVFGEYHPFNALLNLITSINNGKMVPYSAFSMVNYVYVKDITMLIIELIKDKKEYGVVNVGNSLRLEKFVDIIAQELEKKPNKRKIPQFLIKFINLSGIKKLHPISNAIVYDDFKLNEFYTYSYGLQKGIQRTIKYYKEQNLIR